ncbi:MAG: Nif3-like dinuclear metal center hexameric protein [Clostridiales bacterium]|nr:Nif3-like dinuclear metal center hexameric protein [Clostridiales bacterium]
MVCRNVINILNRLAPPGLACEWDNPGFQAGRSDKQIERVLTALDVTDEVVEQAIEADVDLIVSHHPLIFRPLKRVNDEDFISRRIVRLLQHDICYFAMHTNFDIAPGCMADLAAAQLGMIAEEPLEITDEVDGKPVGIGKVGVWKDPVSVEDMAKIVKEKFHLPFVTVFGTGQVTKQVQRIAISPGSGGSMVKAAIDKQAEVLITGDIGHHDGIDAAANGVSVIDAGHYGIEQIFIPFMQRFLSEIPGANLEVITAEPAFPEKLIQ